MLNGYKSFIFLLIFLFSTTVFASVAEDRRITDNEGDVLSINSDGSLNMQLDPAHPVSFPSAIVLAPTTKLSVNTQSLYPVTGNVFATSCNTSRVSIAQVYGASVNQMICITGGCLDTETAKYKASLFDGTVFKLNTGWIELSYNDTIIVRASEDNSFVEVSRSDN